MGAETFRNLRAADFLHGETSAAGLDHGCLPIALQALGSHEHIMDILDGNESEISGVGDILERRGFILNWYVEMVPEIDGSDLEYFLESNVPISKPRPNTTLVGFLGIEAFPDDSAANHAIAIPPRDIMPRDKRRELKRTRSYIMVNTRFPESTLQVHVETLAAYINSITEAGGTFTLIQLWKAKTRKGTNANLHHNR